MGAFEFSRARLWNPGNQEHPASAVDRERQLVRGRAH